MVVVRPPKTLKRAVPRVAEAWPPRRPVERGYAKVERVDIERRVAERAVGRPRSDLHVREDDATPLWCQQAPAVGEVDEALDPSEVWKELGRLQRCVQGVDAT